MIAPLDIYILKSHQLIDYVICSRTSIKDIADYMQLIDEEIMDKITHSYDKVVTRLKLYDCIYKSLIILGLIDRIVISIQKLIYSIAIIIWKLLTNLRSGVL